MKEVRAFLGLTGYYSKFIPDYTNIAAILTDLMNGAPNKIVWTPECDMAKECLAIKLATHALSTSVCYTDRPPFAGMAALAQRQQCPSYSLESVTVRYSPIVSLFSIAGAKTMRTSMCSPAHTGERGRIVKN